MVVAFGGLAMLIGSSVYLAQVYEIYFAIVPTFVVALWYNLVWMRSQPADTAKYIKFNCPKAEKAYASVCRFSV